MGTRTLGPFPQAVLLHQTSARQVGGGSVRYFSSSPVSVPRPEAGGTEVATSCPACGGRVTLRVASEARTRQRRLAWLSLAVAGVALLVVLVAFAGQGSGADGGLVAFGLFGGVFAACVGTARWFREDGVTITQAPAPSPFTPDGAEHLVGFPTVGGSTFTKRGRARVTRSP